MITIYENTFKNNLLDCTISGLAFAIPCKNFQIANGTNQFNISDIDRVLNALVHMDTVMICNDTKSYTLPKVVFDDTLSENEIKEFKVEPFAHQLIAINFMLEHKNLLLLDSMGLG